MSLIANHSFNLGIVSQLRNIQFYEISFLMNLTNYDLMLQQMVPKTRFSYNETLYSKSFEYTWILFIKNSVRAMVDAGGLALAISLVSILT